MPRVKQTRPRRARMTTRPVRSVMGRKVRYGKYGLLKYRKPASIEFASLKETVSTAIVAGNVYDFSAFALADVALERAPSVAKNYQYFRITKIEARLLVNGDTTQVGGAASMAQCYWMINKGQSIPANITFDEFLDLGCRPRALNENNLRWAFAPAIVVAERNLAGGLVSLYPRVSPKLATNANAGTAVAWAPSTAEHGGFLMGVSKINPADNQSYTVQFTYHFKFYKPLMGPSDSSAAHNVVTNV